MQIQLSTREFRIFYDDDFGDHMAIVINALSDYYVPFKCVWFEDFCILSITEKVKKKMWNDILEDVFKEMFDSDEDEETES